MAKQTPTQGYAPILTFFLEKMGSDDHLLELVVPYFHTRRSSTKTVLLGHFEAIKTWIQPGELAKKQPNLDLCQDCGFFLGTVYLTMVSAPQL